MKIVSCHFSFYFMFLRIINVESCSATAPVSTPELFQNEEIKISENHKKILLKSIFFKKIKFII